MLRDDLILLFDKLEIEVDNFVNEDDMPDEIYNELHKDWKFMYKNFYWPLINETIDTRQVYDKLLATFGVMKFKYGGESIIIDSIPELSNIKIKANAISLDSENIIEEYNNIKTMYDNYIKNITNVDFIQVQNTYGNEGLYLAIESLKSLITNNNYRQLLTNEQVGKVLVDCIKLIKKISELEIIETEYNDIISQIYKQTLSNTIDSESFNLLFSNIAIDNISRQASNLLKRKCQSSCSMITSNFIGVYGGDHRRIGFIYPKDSNIIMASAYDLCSNVFGEGVRNKEKGTSLATPEVLERIGIERAKEKGEDLLSSLCYNEVLVDSEPCGILMLGFGENDLNVDYYDTIKLANELKLPLYKVDMLNYKNYLSELDKKYIARHCILSYMGFDTRTFSQLDDDEILNFYRFIDNNKDVVAEKFMELKKMGKLNKENMLQELPNIIDLSKVNDKKR